MCGPPPDSPASSTTAERAHFGTRTRTRESACVRAGGVAPVVETPDALESDEMVSASRLGAWCPLLASATLETERLTSSPASAHCRVV